MSNQSANDPELPVPVVVDALYNSTLPPGKALSGTTVRIDFPGISTEYTVRLLWARPGHIEEFTTQSKGASLPAEVFIPASLVGLSVGKTVQVWYEASSGGEVMLSHKLDLTVEHIPPPICRNRGYPMSSLSKVRNFWTCAGSQVMRVFGLPLGGSSRWGSTSGSELSDSAIIPPMKRLIWSLHWK